ncbi:MAG: GNAT family N-acetyltransferase [Treponema sp.]|nr:GNAT family N-acetyltransferase [Treponema sp.]
MKYRKATSIDIKEICALVKDAICEMEKNGIHQWDDVYPTQEEFLADIEAQSLWVGLEGSQIAVIYALNKWQDPEYFKAAWTYRGEAICVIHRLCVNPKFQRQGVAKNALAHIEDQLRQNGVKSIRLDAFSQNPFALRLYQKAGYEQRGEADWRMGHFLLMEKNL